MICSRGLKNLKGEKLKVKNKIMVLIFLVAILIGCIDSTPTPIVITATPAPTIKYVTETPVVYITATPQPSPSATDEPGSDTPTPTYTEAPSATLNASTSTATVNPDPGGTLTPTMVYQETVDPNLPNRLENPGFEGNVRPVIFGEVNVYEGWEPFYCDTPYTPEKCPLLRQGDGNPFGEYMRRPEYKPIYLRAPHSGASAQQWFCFSGACSGGVYQTFDTTYGETCEVGAYVQSWSNYDDDLPSELSTEDDRNNSLWYILIDVTGDTFAFDMASLPAQSPDLEMSEGFGYDHGIYDQWVKISYTFIAQSNSATVFFGDQRLWRNPNNDSYIDDAYARCE
jgi:hypothetical protein